jgi:hypothetical protein
MAERLLDVKGLKTHFFTDEGVVRALSDVRAVSCVFVVSLLCARDPRGRLVQGACVPGRVA